MSCIAIASPAGLRRPAAPVLGGKMRCRQLAAPPCAAATPWRFDDLSGSESAVRSGVSTFDDLWAEQMQAMQRAQLEMTEMQRVMDQRFAAAQADAQQVEQADGGGQELVQQRQVQDGRCGYSWQRTYERSGGSYQEWRSESFTVIGVQPPGCAGVGQHLSPPAAAAHLGGPWLLLAAAVAGFWAAATAAFHRRFHLTIYKEGSRWRLLLLWPLLLVISPEFRQQFLAAVRGRRLAGGQQEGPPNGGGALAAPGKQA